MADDARIARYTGATIARLEAPLARRLGAAAAHPDYAPATVQPTARPAPVSQPDGRGAERLLDTMRVVKSARFNAAERLERKQAASLFTQSMVALYFIGLAVWQAVYAGQIDDAPQRLLTFLSIVSSVFTLMLGLLEALNDYQMKAHHLHNCALAVSELAQELDIERPSDPALLQQYRRRYNDILKACPVNHTPLDYELAKRSSQEGLSSWLRLRALYLLNVYGLYAVFLGVPPLLWWLHQ